MFHFQFRTFSISISHSFHNVVLNRRHLFMCIGSIFNLGFFFIKQERFILTPIDLKPCVLDAMTYFSWSFKRFEMNILFNWTKSLNWTRFIWLDRSYIFYSGWLYTSPLLFNAYLRYLKSVSISQLLKFNAYWIKVSAYLRKYAPYLELWSEKSGPRPWM